MELENLRRQWQQPSPKDADNQLDENALDQLVARGSRGPAARMRRNVWLEVGVVAGCLAGCLVAIMISHDDYYLLAAAWLAGVGLGSGIYFYRKLAVLRELGGASGAAVREQVAQRLLRLRRLVQLYHRARLWMVPLSLVGAMAFVGGRMVQHLAGDKLVWSLGLLVVISALVYFRLRGFTKRYVQRLYGRHLDRLEANLQELAA
jgi:hypothetical protein